MQFTKKTSTQINSMLNKFIDFFMERTDGLHVHPIEFVIGDETVAIKLNTFEWFTVSRKIFNLRTNCICLSLARKVLNILEEPYKIDSSFYDLITSLYWFRHSYHIIDPETCSLTLSALFDFEKCFKVLINVQDELTLKTYLYSITQMVFRHCKLPPIIQVKFYDDCTYVYSGVKETYGYNDLKVEFKLCVVTYLGEKACEPQQSQDIVYDEYYKISAILSKQKWSEQKLKFENRINFDGHSQRTKLRQALKAPIQKN